MKHTILVLLLAAGLQAAGTVTQTVRDPGNGTDLRYLVIDWTADAADGSVPNTYLDRNAAKEGWSIIRVQTDPGSPAPTANYDIVFVDERGGDVMAGTCANRSATATESCSTDPQPVMGSIQMQLTNNSVNSARGQVVVVFGQHTVAKRGGSGGGGGGGPTGPAGGDLAGTYPNPSIGTGVVGPSNVTSGIEQTANKNQANGYPGLDGTARMAKANQNTWTVYADQQVDANSSGYLQWSSGQLRPPEVVFASLPAASGNTGKVYIVTDCADAACTAGGGSVASWRRSNGSAWVTLGDGGSGGGGGTTYAAANTWTFEVLCAPSPIGTACTGTSETLTTAPTGSSLRLYRNGQLLTLGATGDYTVSTTTITLATTLGSSEVLTADYMIASGSVSDTELGYLDGVTSAIQTQLNGKASTSHTHAAGDVTSGSFSGARLGNPAVGTKGGVEALTCTGNDKISAIGTDGIPVCSTDQTAAGGSGDFSSNTSTSVDGEVVLFSGTAGKTGKRATVTGLAKLASGVLSAAVSGTDYVVPAGNVATATALAANGANCSAGQYARGVDASGAAENCTAVPTPPVRDFGATFDGGGSALTSGTTRFRVIPHACTITGWNISADTGTATVKFWKVASGTARPTVSNSISTSGVALSTGTVVISSTTTDFTTTTIAANDIIGINLFAVSGATEVTAALVCQP